MRWLIYKIINTVNNKIYFGITKRSLKQRFKEHSWNKTSALGRSIRKYGDSLFSIEAIDSAESLKEAIEARNEKLKSLGKSIPNDS